MIVWRIIALLLLLQTLTGCRSQSSFWTGGSGDRRSTVSVDPGRASENASDQNRHLADKSDLKIDADSDEVRILMASAKNIELIAATSVQDEPGQELPVPDDSLPPAKEATLELDQVVQSIYASYPLLQIAFYGREIAAGDQLSAQGAWDLKLKADANNAPLGYYQTYRNGTGFEQPLINGGEVFGLYKIGQGNFEPWYGNRETNMGGEFSTGIRIPLAQNRTIDERRTALWKATYGIGAVEPFIQSQIIEFIRAGTYAYWDWVAAGLNLRVARELLELAEERNDQIEGQVKLGARPESLLVDNQRLIVTRQVKLIEARRKLVNSAIKLSLFLRSPEGHPIIPSEGQLPVRFPTAHSVSMESLPSDVATALSRRPELMELNFQYRITQVDLQQAQNLMQPEIDASFWTAKDMGGWSTPSGNKAPFQAEAGLNFSVPVQRRKARGKITAVEAKLVQIATKRQFAEDKIATEVQNAVVTIEAAFRSIDKAHESVRLNEQMQKFEEIKLQKGDSDLLTVNLREAFTFDARLVEIEAQQRYFESQADFRAAMALDINEYPQPPAP